MRRRNTCTLCPQQHSSEYPVIYYKYKTAATLLYLTGGIYYNNSHLPQPNLIPELGFQVPGAGGCPEPPADPPNLMPIPGFHMAPIGAC